MIVRIGLLVLLISYVTIVNCLLDGYTMEQAQRREPMPEYPNPGEITFKLHAKWDENLLNENSAPYKILEGNVKKAVLFYQTEYAPIRSILCTQDSRINKKTRFTILSIVGQDAEISNVYFRRGYLGMQTSQPITVAHLMVNGGSDSAGILDEAVRPDDTLGDGLKVYKSSFNAY